MPLELPADLEPFVDDYDQMTTEGCYALLLDRPDNPAAAWDRHFDTRPEWFARFVGAEQVAYVGSGHDVLRRLEEHRDGEVRTTVLTEVCEIDGLHTVWFVGAEDTEQLRFEERKLARWLDRERPSWFVHNN